MLMFVCLLGKFACIQELFFLYELTDLSRCISPKAIGKVSYDMYSTSFPTWNRLSLHQNKYHLFNKMLDFWFAKYRKISQRCNEEEEMTNIIFSTSKKN